MANQFRVRKGLIVNGSGSTLLDVQGSQGQLFSITDSLSGSLFAVKDISGIPVIEAFSDNRVNIGTFNQEAIRVSGSFAFLTGSLRGTASWAGNVAASGLSGDVSRIATGSVTASVDVGTASFQLTSGSLRLLTVSSSGTTVLTPTTNSVALSISEYYLTGSSAQPAINITGSWFTSGIPTLINANITDISSSASSRLVILSVNNANVLKIRKTGYINFGPASNEAGIGIGSDINGIEFRSNQAGSTTGYDFNFTSGQGPRSYTAGTSGVITIRGGASQAFIPTSGNGIFNIIEIPTTISQSAAATGVTRGLYINPTLTSAFDWRSIEWSNNTGWGLYGVGTAPNYLNGNTLIGTTTDAGFKLDVNGQARITGITSSLFGTASQAISSSYPLSVTGSTIYTTFPSGAIYPTNTVSGVIIGNNAGWGAIGGTNGVYIGEDAGYSASNASNSTFIGYRAGRFGNSAFSSTFIGYLAGDSMALGNGSLCIAIGSTAGRLATASNSTFIGSNSGFGAAGESGGTADSTIAMGTDSARAAVAPLQTVFIGSDSGRLSRKVEHSVFIGRDSGYSVSRSFDSVGIGRQSGYFAREITEATFLGYRAGGSSQGIIAVSQSQQVVYIGSHAGLETWFNSSSIYIGTHSGRGVYSSSYNVFIGYNTGRNTANRPTASVLGSNNIIIGTNLTLASGSSNSMNIGGIIFGSGSYSIVSASVTNDIPFSGSANGRIGINQPLPQYSLDVSGSIGLSDVLVLRTKDPLPGAGTPTGSLMASGSGAENKPYYWNGATWTALF